MNDTRNWTNVDAGPRQIKPLEKAISALRREGQTHAELTGIAGVDEHTSAYWQPIGAVVRPEVKALEDNLGLKYGWTITKANLKALIADFEAALPEAVKSRPVDDKRRSPDEDAELKAKMAANEAEIKAKQDAANALLEQVTAKAPRGAKALIVAELHEDASDLQTDYHNSHVMRTVAIGFRLSAREDFRALRAAAGQFAETADVEFTEHRDNWSMGAGNYLSDHGSANSGTGWVIKSREVSGRYLNLTEDAIPAAPATATAAPAATNGDGITVGPDSAGRPGIIEIRFPDKPSLEIRKSLKDHHFGYSGRDGVWRGRDAAFAKTLTEGSA